MPWKIEYDINLLKSMAKKDPEMNVCFYGGEPLLNGDIIKKIIKRVPAKKFIIQTNGLLFKQFNYSFWNAFDTILLSIDGVREVTEFYRGVGVYDSVLNAAGALKSLGYNGDIVARMALSERGDVFRDVMHILSLGVFDHVHWQLDVVWSEMWENFDRWAKVSYNPGIDKLVEIWVRSIEQGHILGIAPFQGILRRIAFGGENPPCGAGKDMLAITTDGRILTCPIAIDEKWAEMGHIDDLQNVSLKAEIGDSCMNCDVLKECGGRCLYAHKERFWGEEGHRKICDLNRHIIYSIRNRSEELLASLKIGKITEKELFYPEYNNSIEIIP